MQHDLKVDPESKACLQRPSHLISHTMSDYFTKTRRDELRNEVRVSGFFQDNFLASDPDCSVFGVNLACAYPFPEPLADRYRVFARELRRLGSFTYVYPHWETHITVATLLNFTRNRKPNADRVAELEIAKRRLLQLLEAELPRRLAELRPFVLVTQPPVLSRKVVVLPFGDPSGSIGNVRKFVTSAIESDSQIREIAKTGGFNVPAIIHSTVARFTGSPAEPSSCFPAFDAAAETLPPTEMRISELFVNTETKPYMRGGEIIQRFPLGSTGG
jgi:hypothetical protein